MIVKQNLDDIMATVDRACGKVGRTTKDVHLIAVTKYVSNETTLAAINAGVNDIGENRVEGFQEKRQEVARDNVVWHFIGSLQSRKVKDIINEVDYLHSLDRLSLAKEINKRANEDVNCFVQVNVSGEDSKHGLKGEDVFAFIEALSVYPKIKVVGLMTMAPHINDKERLRSIFKRLKALQQDIKNKNYTYAPCNELSMGMSNDFEIAVEEGATYIRIGTALVGKEW